MDRARSTVGRYLASRLVQLGVKRYFAVPGDYNLALLDEFLATDGLDPVYCCNELNAGYAADGYARATGLAAMIVTFNCGAFSALNAVAGAYAEDLPIVFVSGGPNTNSEVDLEILHHTIAGPDFAYQRDIFRHVTCHAVRVKDPGEAPVQIDDALQSALRERKPVYVEIASNLAAYAVDPPEPQGFDPGPGSDPEALAASTDAVARVLNAAVKPVLVAGSRLRSWGAVDAFAGLADASGYAVATMPDAKGLFAETHPGYMGTYWGPASTPGVGEIVDSADAYLFAGAVLSDYTTAGHSAMIDRRKLVEVEPRTVTMPGHTFSNVRLADFLSALEGKLELNPTAIEAFRRTQPHFAEPERPGRDSPLTTGHLRETIAAMLEPSTTLFVETGDSWFNGMKMDLPEGCAFEIQMKYGSIGWSLGATLGYALGADPSRRVMTMIGDGSFQMTAQEVSTMIRYAANPILFVINNGGYTIEVEIHDGPYNVIQDWKYAQLVDAFGGDGDHAWGTRVTTQGELDDAVARAGGTDGLALIEVVVDRDDCTSELLEWGSRVAANNARPPNVPVSP